MPCAVMQKSWTWHACVGQKNGGWARWTTSRFVLPPWYDSRVMIDQPLNRCISLYLSSPQLPGQLRETACLFRASAIRIWAQRGRKRSSMRRNNTWEKLRKMWGWEKLHGGSNNHTLLGVCRKPKPSSGISSSDSVLIGSS